MNNTPTCHEQFNLSMAQSFTDFDSIMSTGKRHLKSSSSDAVGDCSAPFLSNRSVEPPHGDPSQTENEDRSKFEKRLVQEEEVHLVAIMKGHKIRTSRAVGSANKAHVFQFWR